MEKVLKFNSIYYLFIFFIIGVPIWYFTVSTYRSSLPFDEIDRLATLNKFEVQLKFELILNTADKTTVATKFQQLLNQSKLDSFVIKFFTTFK